MKSDKNFDDVPTVNQLSADDTVPADAVSRDPTAAPIHALVFDKDRFGNVLKALFRGDGEFAYATRRDDCYVETDDGRRRRPDWKVREAGSLTPVTVPDDWQGADDDEIIGWTLDPNLYHINDINYSTSTGKVNVKRHNPDDGRYDDITFRFESSDDAEGDDESAVTTDGGVDVDKHVESVFGPAINDVADSHDVDSDELTRAVAEDIDFFVGNEETYVDEDVVIVLGSPEELNVPDRLKDAVQHVHNQTARDVAGHREYVQSHDVYVGLQVLSKGR